MSESKSEPELVPRARYIFLMAAVLIAVIGGGSAVGFSSITGTFMENVHKLQNYMVGREGMEFDTDSGIARVNLGIDMKGLYNETHGLVYWFMDVEVAPGSTVIDLIQNSSVAQKRQYRIYSLTNSSEWVAINDTGVGNWFFDVEYGDIGGMRYIYAINGTASDPGNMRNWMVFVWDQQNGRFSYLSMPPDVYRLSDLETVVLLYDQVNMLPADCCSGFASEYQEYEGGQPT